MRLFHGIRALREYFAVKATPNPFIIKKLAEVGCGVDCLSYTELMIADKLGLRNDEIMFSSNETPEGEFAMQKRGNYYL